MVNDGITYAWDLVRALESASPASYKTPAIPTNIFHKDTTGTTITNNIQVENIYRSIKNRKV